MARPSTTLPPVTIIRQTDRKTEEREVVIVREGRDGGVVGRYCVCRCPRCF